MQRRLESIVITIFLGIIPILVSPFSAELFEFPKTIFLYFITGLLLMVLTWNGSLKLNGLFINRTLFFSLLLIASSSLISTFFSIDHYTSIFGYYTRFNGGLLSILCLLTWSIYLMNLKLNDNEKENILFVVLLSGLVVSVYALLQKIGLDTISWTDNPAARVFSTLGQPNWLAAYLIPGFYLAVYFGIKFQKNIFLKLFPALIIYLAIWFTYSISGIIALFISLTLFLLLFPKQLKKTAKKYWHIGASLVAITIIAAIPLQHRITEQINNMEGIITLLTTNSTGRYEPNYGDTGKIRLILWQGSLDLITSSPKQFLIGSGPETFVYAFPKFRPEAINATSEANFIHNKPHNWYLEVFSNLGILGLSAYLFFIWKCIASFHKSTQTPASKALFAGWVSILVSNFFGWPTVPLSILFFILPVLFLDKLPNSTTMEIKNFHPYVRLILFSIAAGFLLFAPVILFAADLQYKKGNYLSATKLNPFEPRYELFAMIYEESWNPERTLNFYSKNKHNPFIVKTMFSVIDSYSKINPELESVVFVKNEIQKDAAANSPADNQFTNY